MTLDSIRSTLSKADGVAVITGAPKDYFVDSS